MDNSEKSKPEFRVIIAGTRDFSDYQLLRDKCDAILSSKKQDSKIIIVSGTARGADQMGERYARERGYRIERYPADWDRDGNSAGPIRNALMADNADALIAFWDGRSRGTMNMIDTAKDKGLMVRIVNYQRTNVKQPTIQQLKMYEANHPKLKLPETPLTEVLAQARKLFGDEIFIRPVEVDLGRGKEKIVTILYNPRDGGYYKGGTMNEITTNIVEKDIEVLTRSVRDAIVNGLKRLPGAYLAQLDEELKRVVNNSGLRSEEKSPINDEKKAGPIRNAKMADNADALIAFWDGQSRGTKNMIETAKMKGLEIRTINTNRSQAAAVTVDPKIAKLRAETSQYAIEHITGNGMHRGIRWLQDSFNDYYKAICTPGVKISEESDIAHRKILAQKVAIDCIHALNKEQLEQLDKVLEGIAKDITMNNGLRR